MMRGRGAAAPGVHVEAMEGQCQVNGWAGFAGAGSRVFVLHECIVDDKGLVANSLGSRRKLETPTPAHCGPRITVRVWSVVLRDRGGLAVR